MNQHLRFLGVLFATIVIERSAFAESLSAGVAVVDITPPVPYRMSGYFYERVSTGVTDPLKVKAVAFQQGDQSAALAFCDLIGLPRTVTDEARRRASKATGIRFENIAVTATHSHTGPLYYGALRDHFHHRSVGRLGHDPYEKVDYSEVLVDRIAKAIESAFEAKQPAELRAGFAREDRVAFNRRYHMRDGTVRFNPGPLNPDIVRPAGPIDPEVGIITLTLPDEKSPTAAVVSYALHLDTTHGTAYSADYPGPMEMRLQESLGSEFTALFATGTCGDVNHADVTKREERPAQEIGRMLGNTVAEAISSDMLSVIAAPKLAVRSATVAAPLQVYSTDDVAKAKKNMVLIGGRELPFLDQVEAYKITALQAYKGADLPLEVQAFRLGPDTVIVTLPGEIFVELGLAIKVASPFKTTLVVELANDSPGYIPTKMAFAEGSYEIVNSRVQSGSGEMLVDAAKRLLEELR